MSDAAAQRDERPAPPPPAPGVGAGSAAPADGPRPAPPPPGTIGPLPPPRLPRDTWHVLTPLVPAGTPSRTSGPARVAAVPVVEGPGELATVLAAVAAEVPASQDALVVLPSWGPARQREAWDAARALLPDRRLLLVETDLPPLAARLLVATLADLAVHVERLEELALAATTVEARMVAAAWVGSVTRLEHVEVPMALHVRSYVGRRGFVVRVTPQPSVTPVGRDHGAAALPLPSPATVLVAATGGSDEGAAVVTGMLGGARAERTDPSEQTTAWWGCDKVAEVAAVSTDLAALAGAARTRATTCPWCGATATVGAACARCGASTAARAPVARATTTGAGSSSAPSSTTSPRPDGEVRP